MSQLSKFRDENPALDSEYSIRSWLVSDEDGRAVVQVTLSNGDDHVLASGLSEGETILIAQHMALSVALAYYFGGDAEDVR